MARNLAIQHIRTTRANLDIQATANNLKAGELYLITDEDRIAVGLTVSTYQTYVKPSDITALTAKTTIVDADSLTGVNSESGNVITRWTWANIKTFLSSIFITVSQATGQTIGATGSRLTKLWATDITVTNPINGTITNVVDNAINYAKSGSEFKDDLTITANAIDWASGVYKAITLTANTTFTFSNIEKQKVIHLKITGAFTITWPSGCIVINGGTYTGAKQNNYYIECVSSSTPEFKIAIQTEP